MFDTIILFLCGVTATITSILEFKKGKQYDSCGDSNAKYICKLIGLFGLIGPLMEEAIFRSVLKSYLQDIAYGNYINAILFGLSHGFNYFVHNNAYIITIQMITTSYLGFYVIQFDNFSYAFLTHGLYNTTILLITFMYHLYNKKETGPYIFPSIMISMKTQDDFNLNKSCKFRSGYKFVKREKINKEMLDRIDKLDRIETKYDKFKNIENVY